MVTSLGRGISGNTLEKHRIKRADRLLSNAHFHEELEELYSNLAHMAVGKLKRVVILIDWSNLDKNERHFLLRASVPTKGRSITVYEEVHTKKTKEKLKTHKSFLRNLKRILPNEVNPIIVTDAGFRVTWFREVEKHGWDWVGRVRGRMKVRLDEDSEWTDGRLLHHQALSKARNFDTAQIAIRNVLDCRLVLYKGKPKGRVMLDKFGRRRTWIRAMRAERASREPLLLATSLCSQDYGSAHVVKMYSSRMQIEESFRDMKSHQYGIGLKEARTYKTKRMAVLVAIATLANTFSWLLGKATESKELHQHFQANSIKKQKILSYVFIGLRVFKQRRIKIEYQTFKNTLHEPSFIAEKLCLT